MTGATHFIELWQSSNGSIINTHATPIGFLNSCLFGTKAVLGCTTIAIWYIKFKTKDNGTITRELNG